MSIRNTLTAVRGEGVWGTGWKRVKGLSQNLPKDTDYTEEGGWGVGGGGQRWGKWGWKETLLGVVGAPCCVQMCFIELYPWTCIVLWTKVTPVNSIKIFHGKQWRKWFNFDLILKIKTKINKISLYSWQHFVCNSNYALFLIIMN